MSDLETLMVVNEDQSKEIDDLRDALENSLNNANLLNAENMRLSTVANEATVVAKTLKNEIMNMEKRLTNECTVLRQNMEDKSNYIVELLAKNDDLKEQLAFQLENDSISCPSDPELPKLQQKVLNHLQYIHELKDTIVKMAQARFSQ